MAVRLARRGKAKLGRPPVDDPWVNLSVRLRRSDLEAYRAKIGASASVALRAVVLAEIRKETP